MIRPLLAALALVALVAGCAATPAAPAGGAAAGEPAASPAPTSVRIPQIAIRSTLTRTGKLPDGSPEVPPVTAPMQASWATWSPEPGTIGPAVLYGHVDGQVDGRRGVPGVFAQLHRMQPEQLVFIDRADGSTVTFAVTRVARYPKDAFDDPRGPAARDVYGDTTAAELRLVTCGGSFDEAARSYRDQIVVFARAV